MAEALVEAVLKEDFEILERYTGKDLEYKEYEPLFDFVNPNKKCWFVTCDTYVTEAVLKEDFEILERYTGKDLEYKEYEPLFDFVNPNKKCWFVTCDTYVTLTDGTGVVHIAPAFGEDDANVGRNYDLPFVQLVDAKGEMTKETPWAGTFCKKADNPILVDLEERGLLFDAPKYEHSYPHCWRCDTPLIYYARESWFIKMTAVKELCKRILVYQNDSC